MAKPMPPEVEPQNLNHWATKEASLLCVCVTVQGRTLPGTREQVWGDFGVTGSHSRCSVKTCHPVAKSCPALCDLMDCSTPGFSVVHCLPEFAQFHVH